MKMVSFTVSSRCCFLVVLSALTCLALSRSSSLSYSESKSDLSRLVHAVATDDSAQSKLPNVLATEDASFRRDFL